MQLRSVRLSRRKTVEACARSLVSIAEQSPEGRRWRQALRFGTGGGLQPKGPLHIHGLEPVA